VKKRFSVCRIADHRLRVRHVVRLPCERRDHRPGWREAGVGGAQPFVLLPDAEEPAVMSGLPVPAGALALLDDLIERLLR
jgi:hypothetical protein